MNNYPNEKPDLYTLGTCLFEKKPKPGEWFDFGLFEVKGFKNGSAHIKFKNEKDWEALNRAYAKIKGQVLPENI